jgi:hypothetical protein
MVTFATHSKIRKTDRFERWMSRAYLLVEALLGRRLPRSYQYVDALNVGKFVQKLLEHYLAKKPCRARQQGSLASIERGDGEAHEIHRHYQAACALTLRARRHMICWI